MQKKKEADLLREIGQLAGWINSQQHKQTGESSYRRKIHAYRRHPKTFPKHKQ